MAVEVIGQLGKSLHLVLDNSHAFKWHRNLGKGPGLKSSKIPLGVRHNAGHQADQM